MNKSKYIVATRQVNGHTFKRAGMRMWVWVGIDAKGILHHSDMQCQTTLAKAILIWLKFCLVKRVKIFKSTCAYALVLLLLSCTATKPVTHKARYESESNKQLNQWLDAEHPRKVAPTVPVKRKRGIRF